MESSLFFGGSVIAATVAGMLALFAPRCISFMLPAYFASSFQNRLWQSSRLFHPRSFNWYLGPLHRTLSVTNLLSGLLLLLMGGAMIWVGVTSTAMPVPAGWQASFFVWLQHIGHVMTSALSWLPNWAAALVLLGLIGGLTWRALKQVGTSL